MFKSFVRFHHCVPLVKSSIPSFQAKALIDGSFKSISSEDFAGQYWVLFFYPLDFTFVCPTELIAFNDRLLEFDSINTKVVAASVDSEYSHLAWTQLPRNQGGLGPMKLPLISDLNKSLATKFGILLPDSGVALRGLFIIDPNGKVRHMSVNDLPIGRSVDETLRLVKAIQFFDKNGEVCPADWQPGKNTIKPNVVDAKEYFSSQ